MRRYLLPVVAGLGLTAVLAFIRLRGEPDMERIGVPPEGRLEKTDAEWRQLLTPSQYAICRAGGTERAFTGEYWNLKTSGSYLCACCGQALFSSETKFDSGTGWPSFFAPVDEESISLLPDDSWFMRRTEVKCSRCDAHLGHVFKDGPAPTGLRYCMNSAALRFVQRDSK